MERLLIDRKSRRKKWRGQDLKAAQVTLFVAILYKSSLVQKLVIWTSSELSRWCTKWSLAGVVSDESVVTLNVGHNSADEAGLGSGGLSGSGGLLSFFLVLLRLDLSNLGGLFGKFDFVSLSLSFLGLDLLTEGASLGNLLVQELVLSLDGVGVLARDEHGSEEEDGEDEAAKGVPDESVSVDDAEDEDAPPVERVEDPEEEQGDNDLEDVEPRVLVDALVVGLIDRVVPVSVSKGCGGFALLRVCVDRVRLHFLAESK